MVIDFVWSHKNPKIRKDTLIGPKEKGGLDLPELSSTSKSLKIAWVKRMIESNMNNWMTIPLDYLRHVGGTLVFECDYDITTLDISGLPPFYYEVLIAWSQVQALNSANRTTDIILWNNKNITIAGKSVYYHDWHQVGIKNNQRFYDLFCEKFNLNAPAVYTILTILRSSFPTMKPRPEKRNPHYLTKSESDFSHRLRRLGITDSDTIKAIYEFPFKITKETKLCIFQFKINHNILPHGYWLHQMKILDSPLCPSCGENETLMQMLASCPSVSVFWLKVPRWWNVNTHTNTE